MKEKNSKEIEKDVFNKYLSAILTIIVIITFFWKYVALIYVGIVLVVMSFGKIVISLITSSNPSIIITILSVLLILIVDIRSLYLYIKYILESFSKKKRIKSILLTLILIAVIALFITEEYFMNTKFIALSNYILIITCINIIPIIRTIIDLVKINKNNKNNKRNKIVKTTIMIIILIITQFFMMLYSYAVTNGIINVLKRSSFSDIFALKEERNVNNVTNNTISNAHISDVQRNLNITFLPKSKLKEEWISLENQYNAQQKGATNYTFENKINLKSNKNEVSFMKVCFQLKNDLKNYVPVEENEENYNKIDSYLVASSIIQITLKPGVELKNKYYTVRFNRYDENYNLTTNYSYIFEPVAEIGIDSEGKQVIEINYDKTYMLGELKNIEIILGSE